MKLKLINFSLLLLLISLSKEWILFNEEFLIIISFLVVFFFLVYSLKTSVAFELDEKKQVLLNKFNDLYLLKQLNLINVIKLNYYYLYKDKEWYNCFNLIIQDIYKYYFNFIIKEFIFLIYNYSKILLNICIMKLFFEYSLLYQNKILNIFNYKYKTIENLNKNNV